MKKKAIVMGVLLVATIVMSDVVTIDESYNSGANIAAYQGYDTTNPYDSIADGGSANFGATKGVGSNASSGLYRQMFYFQLPDGYSAASVTSAVFRFTLSSKIGGPSMDMDIYSAYATSLGGQNGAAGIASFNDGSFSDTGLGLTSASGNATYDFDVTSLIQDAINQGNLTNVIAFRLQMSNDTALTFGSDDRYVIIGYGIGDLNASKRPELVIETSSGPVSNEVITIDKAYNGGASIAAYQGYDTTNPYDGTADAGLSAFSVTKGIGSNSTGGGGLYRQMFYFQLPDGYNSAQVVDAVFSFSLNTKIGDPTSDMDIYYASAASLGSGDGAAGKVAFDDAAFSDTGLGLTSSSGAGRYNFDVTSLVQDALNQGNPTNVIAFRLQMGNDTSLTFGSDERYVVIGYGIADTNSQPRLVLEMGPETFTYNSWISGYGLTDTNGTAALTADPDDDGFSNLAEYALGGNPVDSAVSGHAAEADIKTLDGTNWFEVVHFERVDKDIRGLSYTPEQTVDLLQTNWVSTGFVDGGFGGYDADFNVVTSRIEAATQTRFIRLSIEQQ